MSYTHQEAPPNASQGSLRPLSITILAGFLIVGAALFLVMKPLTWSQMSTSQNLWNSLMKTGTLAAGIGMLGMHRWAVILYFATAALNAIWFFSWSNTLMLDSFVLRIVQMLVGPAIVAAVTLPHWKSMKN